jgi:MFS family permease
VASSLPRLPLVLLGVVSVVAFGVWFYGFGVLIEPIAEDTGWREGVLSAVYGASLLLTGIGGAIAGRLLDSTGSRRLYVVASLLAGGPLAVAATTGSLPVFAVAATVGGAATGAVGYYSATTTVMARLAPEHRAAGITAITLFGAFASPVALPALAFGIDRFGWRPTLLVAASVVTAALLSVGVLLPDVHAPASTRPSLRSAAGAVRGRPALGGLFAAGTLGAVATSILLLYQVPAMTDAGLALTTASAFAGARGVAQLAGRLPLPALLRRVETGRVLAWSYVLTAAGCLLLPGAGDVVTASVFVAVAGVAIGALAALEGIYATEVVDDDVLGTTLGLYGLVRGVGAAGGPVVAGVVLEASGSRVPALLAAGVAAAAGAVVVTRTRSRTSPTSPISG